MNTLLKSISNFKVSVIAKIFLNKLKHNPIYFQAFHFLNVNNAEITSNL